METEKLKEKWEEVCFLLCDKIKNDVREEFFEKEVLRVLEKLGWSQYKGEIAIKPSFSFGSQQSIKPDYVLYDRNKKAVVVVEVKRPSEDLSTQQVVGQLTSYMRQPKADFGLLIGNQIHIYYDGNLYPHDEPILVRKIDFVKDLTEGPAFIGIFKREFFFEKKYEHYMLEWIKQVDKEVRIKKLKETMASKETQQKISNFLKTEFTNFGTDILDDTIKEFEINVLPIGASCEVKEISVIKSNLIEGKETKMKKDLKNNFQQKNYIPGQMYKLNELMLKELKGTKPLKLQMDNKTYDIKSWTDLEIKFVQLLIEKGYLSSKNIPLPNYADNGKYFINIAPVHRIQEIGTGVKWKKVGNYYVDPKHDADAHIKMIRYTMKQLNIFEGNIMISLR